MGGKLLKQTSTTTLNISSQEINNDVSISEFLSGTGEDKLSLNTFLMKTIIHKDDDEVIFSTKNLKKLDYSNIEFLEEFKLKLILKHNKNLEDKELIDNCLQKHFFLRTLSSNARKEIIAEMSLYSFQCESTLFEQGSPGKYFYIIKEGEVSVFINNSFVKNLSVGESFGELALLHNAPRSATIKTNTPIKVWCMERRNFRKIVDHINSTNNIEIEKYLSTIPFLNGIDPSQKQFLSTNLSKHYYVKGSTIVKEGEMSNCIYIVKDGKVNCVKNGIVLRTLVKGEYFGEMSIILNTERTMDVVADENCILYVLSIDTLIKLVGEQYREVLFLSCLKKCFQTSKCFNKIELDLIDKTFEIFKVINVAKGSVVLKKGDNKSSYLYIIIQGNLLKELSKEVVATRGSILFEHDVINKTSSLLDENILADPDCLVCYAESFQFFNLIGEKSTEDIFYGEIHDFVKQVPLFQSLSKKKLDCLVKVIYAKRFLRGDYIIRQGEEDSKFYIIKSGKVDIVISGKYIRTLNPNEGFGERALFFKEKRSASAIAQENVEVFQLEEKDFNFIMEENLKEYLFNRLYLQDNKVELKDLDYIKKLGSGSYSSVYLVQSKTKSFYYALKSISLSKIEKLRLYNNLEREKNVLLKIDHPFILKLVKTLKDDQYAYFLIEYIKGRMLREIVADLKYTLTKEQSQFYIGSMMLAIDYLHSKNIIYRNVKPDNIIVSMNGYLKFIDFGLSKEIDLRTSTIVGSPYFMAPEVVVGEGYTFSIDYWSIAVCLYLFVCGNYPFGKDTDDPMTVYIEIINNDLKFPSNIRDKEFKNLLSYLLNKDPFQRLYKLSYIKNHPWFFNFNWEGVLNMTVPPPVKISEPNYQIEKEKELLEVEQKKSKTKVIEVNGDEIDNSLYTSNLNDSSNLSSSMNKSMISDSASLNQDTDNLIKRTNSKFNSWYDKF